MNEEKRFYQRPRFASIVLGILLVVIYGIEYKYQSGILNVPGILLDLFLLFVLVQITVAFYAQFVLPIQKRKDRSIVIGRLWLHARGGHGPAIFVKNGRLVESKGESEKKGPGVLWLDTASAVVTRTDVSLKHTLGPGVHFTDKDEKIASVISLHTQTHRIGPKKEDEPFKAEKDYAPKEEYQKANERRMAVSAITRDGIEVVPNISVTFKIDAAPAKGKEKGSRFGYDENAVERAVKGEGVSAASGKDEPKHVSWNQLPALIAADLWREYLGKFTLNELFSASRLPPSDVLQPPAPTEVKAESPAPAKAGIFTRMLRAYNDRFEKRLKKRMPEEQVPTIKASEKPEAPKKAADPQPTTALQIINQMMKARMTQANVPVLDESGQPLEGFRHSQEFDRLNERGIKVASVSVSGLQFNKAVETELVNHWNSSWLLNAKADQSRIERLTAAYNVNGKQKALHEHASNLSEAINDPADVAAAVKALLKQTQSEIKLNDRLLRRTTREVQDIEDIINWMESKV
jgi:hypothetical protein